MYHMCRNPHEGPPSSCWNMYSGTFAPASLVDERDLPHQMRLIDDVVDCSIPPMAEEGILTYLLCVFWFPF